MSWKEPSSKGGSDLQYFVVVNGDKGRFTKKLNHTVYQKEEAVKYTISVYFDFYYRSPINPILFYSMHHCYMTIVLFFGHQYQYHCFIRGYVDTCFFMLLVLITYNN